MVCATSTENAVWCWGEIGREGPHVNAPVLVPSPVPLHDVVIATEGSSREHGCGLDTRGAAYCWGDNVLGELGVGDPPSYQIVREPRPVVGGHLYTMLALGPSFSCGIGTDGTLWCWGSVHSNGPVSSVIAVPTSVTPGIRFRTVSVGYFGGCAVSTEGEAYCWRDTGFQPTKVATDLRFRDVREGFSHRCGVTTTGDLYCWGYNGAGQLGTGTRENSATPVLVRRLYPISAPSAGIES